MISLHNLTAYMVTQQQLEAQVQRGNKESTNTRPGHSKTRVTGTNLTLWRRIYFFFLILAHPVYKMWIIQEPNKLALWNKLYFEEKKKTEILEHV